MGPIFQVEKSGDRVGTLEGRHTCVMEGPRSGVRVIIYFCVREAYTCKSGVGRTVIDRGAV